MGKISFYLFTKDCLKYDLRELLRWPVDFLLNHIIFPRKSWYAAALRGIIINLISGQGGVSFVYKNVRVSSYRDLKLGKDAVIEEGVVIDGPLTMEDLCVLGTKASIEGPVTMKYGSSMRDGCVAIRHTTLEEWVGISSNVRFITFTHDIGDITRRVGTIKYKPILVKAGTWIGTDTTVLPGVTIGEGCVIGARSLVTKDIPDNSLAIGAPAKVMRKLGPDVGGGLPPEYDKVWRFEKW
jgi:acetyltransferase-like isoleucine patch superfamily enzyme